MALLNPTDFVGFWQISKAKYDEARLNLFIDDVQARYLDDLLGCALAELYITSLETVDGEGVPTDARFAAIHKKICEIDECDVRHYSEGIPAMLKGFTYYEYVPNHETKHTGTGLVKVKGENSERVEANASLDHINERYNRSIESYRAIQWFICEQLEVYPEYKGIEKRYNFFNGAF